MIHLLNMHPNLSVILEHLVLCLSWTTKVTISLAAGKVWRETGNRASISKPPINCREHHSDTSTLYKMSHFNVKILGEVLNFINSSLTSLTSSGQQVNMKEVLSLYELGNRGKLEINYLRICGKPEKKGFLWPGVNHSSEFGCN